jgi:hypothetical protein
VPLIPLGLLVLLVPVVPLLPLRPFVGSFAVSVSISPIDDQAA